jgi:hypothetical protein
MRSLTAALLTNILPCSKRHVWGCAGVLRMKPFPNTLYDSCFPGSYLTLNSIKSLCGVEYKALVEASGIIRLTPLSKATFNYGYQSAPANVPMPCKDLNASGLFNSTFPTSSLLSSVSCIATCTLGRLSQISTASKPRPDCTR